MRTDGHTDRRTERYDKAIRSFAKAPQKIENRFETLRTANGPTSNICIKKKKQLNGGKFFA